MDAAVVCDKVTRRFKGFTALQDVSFSVPKGSVFGLLGPNGAGKTTLFSIIADYLRADAGTVQVLGHDSRTHKALVGRLTTLPQDALFQSNVPVVEQMVYFARLSGMGLAQARQAVLKVMQQVGLADELGRRATELSHGMAKRLGLAQAFLGEPEVVLLDEPTAGLDPANAEKIRRLITQLRERNATIIVSSHNMQEMQRLCDRVAILAKGALVSVGPVQDLLVARHRLELVPSRDLNDADVSALAAVSGVLDCKRDIGQSWALTIALDEESGDIDAVTDRTIRCLLELGITPRFFKVGSSLQDHFLDVTGVRSEDAELDIDG